MQDQHPGAFSSAHVKLSRRWLLKLGAMGAAIAAVPTRVVSDDTVHATMLDALAELETYLTRQQDFRDVSRGRPKPHQLDDAAKEQAGLTRETWRLTVDSDPEHPARISHPMTAERETQLDFDGLMQLAKSKAVRFAKVMTCLNIGCPLGMGIWEGVPLRDVIWMTQPTENLRRVHYYGFHNDDPEQMFRSSLPIGRVFEDPFGLPPVILCYKLNDEWLSPKRGGPVRVVVPEAYGFKSIKWLQHVVLSNIAHANDTYAEQNNDVDSPLKTFAATLTVPEKVAPSTPFAITGYAQSGISGLSKVQVWIQNRDDDYSKEDRYFVGAPWADAEMLDRPSDWGAEFAGKELAMPLHGFNAETQSPLQWPMKLAKAHWAFQHQGLPTGKYVVRCRTIDENEQAQPMPRPFRKSGHAAIEEIRFEVS